VTRVGPLAIALVALVLAGCCSYGCGPLNTLALSNATDHSVLVRMSFVRFELEPGEGGTVPTNVYEGMHIDLVDEASCKVTATYAVSFPSDSTSQLVEIQADKVIQEAVSDPPAAAATRFPFLEPTYNLCPQSDDGLTLSIHNVSAKLLHVIVFDSSGLSPQTFNSVPGSSGILRARRNAVIAVVDEDCGNLQRLPAAEFGPYQLTIGDGPPAFTPGPVGTDPPLEPKNPGACPIASLPASVAPPDLTYTELKMSVTPATGLRDGQTVKVTLTGWGVAGNVWLSECSSEGMVSTNGCGGDFTSQTLVVTGLDRSATADFVVRGTAPNLPAVSPSAVVCKTQCVIMATMGVGYGFGWVPISFATP
jgi:hypothetical protein